MGWIKKNIKLIAFCLIIVVIFLLDQKYGWSQYLSDSANLKFLSDMIGEHFALAGLIYTALTVVACVVLALPGVTFAILAAVLFGPWWGTLFCLIATTLGAMIAFLAGRFFLKDSIKPMVEKSALLKRLLFDEADKSDIVLLAITRLVPLFPYNVQNFAYGITDISFAHYSLYTFLFMIPGVSLYTIGTSGFTSESDRGLYFGIAAALLVLVVFLGWFIKNKYLGNGTGDIKSLTESRPYREGLGLPSEAGEEYRLLAQGEYNQNYVFDHPVTGERLVLRINTGSQMHLDRQIEYEAHALELLSESGRTPKVLYADGSKQSIEYGILVMEYLPGRHPDYRDSSDMEGVMRCMADIHSVQIDEKEVIFGEPFGEDRVPADTVRLIAPGSSAGSIIDECGSMLQVYEECPDGDEEIKRRLRRLLEEGRALAGGSIGAGPPLRRCINTELNSTNFLVDDGGFVRLVDWEKPLYADPAQDIGHLLAPTTTFWKTDVVLTEEETDRLIDIYVEAVGSRFDTKGIRERIKELISITCLRGLTWCAMAWVEYQDPSRPLTNESTRVKLDQYLSDAFLSDIEKRFGIR